MKVAAAHARVERVVDAVMVEGEPLGVLHRQALPFGVAGVTLPVEHVRVVVLGDRVLGPWRGTPLLADHAPVDLGDAHPRQLALADGHDALLVDRVAQRARADSHLGAQRPHPDLGIGLAGRDFDVRHQSTPNSSRGLSHAMCLISASVTPSAYSASA